MGTLYIVATPIGNLEDITIRAINTLVTVPVVACEDTRHTGQLIKIVKERYRLVISNFEFLIPKQKFISVRDWNEGRMVSLLLGYLVHSDVALVCDAGTPLISDPGYKVVRAARAAGFGVSPIPGPAAVTAALSASGLPTNKFLFLGFLPKKWELLSGLTHVIYESPTRLEKTLRIILERYPEAEVIIARELTKVHEQFVGYALGDRLGKIKGEATVLVWLPERNIRKEISADHGNGNGNVHG